LLEAKPKINIGKPHNLCRESAMSKLLIAKRFFLVQNSGTPAGFKSPRKLVAKKMLQVEYRTLKAFKLSGALNI
jgi:hypothetical protein